MNGWDRYVAEALLERAIVALIVRWQSTGHGWG